MENKCQYPSGDGPPYKFCLKEAVIGSYCRAHHKLCYRKTDKIWLKKPIKLWKYK